MTDQFEIADKFLEELKGKYPLLYKQRLWVEYSSGWYDLIRNLSSEIYELYNSWGSKYTELPYVVQMKEKFGGLRYYMYYGELSEEDHRKLNEIVDRYERKSITICEVCSQPGINATTGDDYWYSTLCNTCRADKLKRYEEKYGTNGSNKE